MKKMKRLATMLVAGLMASVMAFPSLAVTYEYNTGSTEIREDRVYHNDGSYVELRWASGQTRTYPGWVWLDGYCYYYTDYLGGNKLTSCVTPDGYTVDELGRWTEGGVPQNNGYGSFVVGTDELYAGKSDDERWIVMRNLYENLFANYTIGGEHSVAMMATSDNVYGTWTKEGLAGHIVAHKPQPDYSYLHLYMANTWNDAENDLWCYQTEVFERMLKIACGDHVGQELFNDIRKAAEPANGDDFEMVVFDENGQLIWLDGNHVLTKTITNSGDGVDFTLFDLNKWNGRKTDYGKTIEIIPATRQDKWELIIKD